MPLHHEQSANDLRAQQITPGSSMGVAIPRHSEDSDGDKTKYGSSSSSSSRTSRSSTITVPDEHPQLPYTPSVKSSSSDSKTEQGDASIDTPNTASSNNLGNIPLEPDTKVSETPDGLPNLSRTHECFFVFTICMAQLFSLAALAITVAPLPIISRAFQVTDLGQLSWYTAAYSLTLGTFILPAGRLGDVYGHRKIFVVGWLWFALWSAICGLSYRGGPIMLSVCRAFQGIGPALVVPNGIALIGRTFPIGLKRSLAIAWFGGCGPVGFTVGAVMSSVFAQLVWWPWAFWVLAVACLGVSALSFIVIPHDTIHRADVDMKLSQKLDFAGAATGVSGLVLINFAFNQAPVIGWQKPYIPILLVLGIALMGAFVYIELRVAIRPIVPIKGLHRDAAFTLACIFAGWASHGVWVYYLYLLLENIRGHSPLGTCLQTFPVAPVGFCAASAVPFILRKLKVQYLMSIAMMFFCVGTILLVTAPAHQTYWANVFVSIILMPFAMNWSFPSGTILMSSAVSREHQGIAASLISTMVNYSISMGLGIAGSIDRYVTPEHGELAGYRGAWYLGIGLGAIGLVISGYFIWSSRVKK